LVTMQKQHGEIVNISLHGGNNLHEESVTFNPAATTCMMKVSPLI
jgi:hypothetical protein